jgi:hypothetical protein
VLVIYEDGPEHASVANRQRPELMDDPQMNNPTPRTRRGLRFSLRTMFVLATVACVWLGYHLNWMRERHAFLASLPKDWQPPPWHTHNTPAPLGLWLLGETGITSMWIAKDEDEKIHLAPKLFPEARVVVVVGMLLLTPAQYWEWKRTGEIPIRPSEKLQSLAILLQIFCRSAMMKSMEDKGWVSRSTVP